MAAPKENTNAEVWSLKSAIELYEKAIDLTKEDDGLDFIGEVAKKLNTYREVFVYLNGKFEEIKPLHKRLISNVEANCFSHGKKGTINTAMAIVNLKSNHNWTDRAETTLQGGDKPIQTEDLTGMTTQELIERAKAVSKISQSE